MLLLLCIACQVDRGETEMAFRTRLTMSNQRLQPRHFGMQLTGFNREAECRGGENLHGVQDTNSSCCTAS